MNPYNVKHAVTPLRMIFWGGLLWIIDIKMGSTVNGSGFACDISNDTVGTLLIAFGVRRLLQFPIGKGYARAMRFVWVISILAVIASLKEFFVAPLPDALQIPMAVLWFVKLAAIITFCFAMHWFCDEVRLSHAARSWEITTVLFAVLDLIPLALAGTIAIAQGRLFPVDVGWIIIPMAIVACIPLIHLFISISRTARAVDEFWP